MPFASTSSHLRFSHSPRRTPVNAMNRIAASPTALCTRSPLRSRLSPGASSVSASARYCSAVSGASLSVGEPLYTANWIVLHIVAQSMARELGPRGIHVAHVIVDGQVRSDRYEHLIGERGPDSLIEPEAAVEAYWQLSRQPRSAWSFEVDLRPWVERF